MDQASVGFKNWGASIVIVALVIALGLFFLELEQLSGPVIGASLPLVAVGGVIALILLLTIVTMIFSKLGLTNQNQAMGLPEGSIRAVIALSLIVLFAVLSVFLYKSIAEGKLNTVAHLSDTERKQFIREHATLQDIRSTVSKDEKGNDLSAKDKDGKLLKNDDGTPQNLYDVSYRSVNAASDDFAKQLLVLLGTLMTAITSFYLGAGTATLAAAKAGETPAPSPTVSSIKRNSYSIANDGPVIHLEIMGANLNTITHVKIVRAGAQPVIATTVHSSPTSITCDIPVSAATTPSGTPWDVVVDDGGSKSFTLPGALTIAP